MLSLVFETHIMVDSEETAKLLAVALGKMVSVAAGATVDSSDAKDPRVILGVATLRTNPGKFVPHATPL